MDIFKDSRKCEITVGEARKINAILRSGSYVPSIFQEVAEVINLLETKFKEINKVVDQACNSKEKNA